MTTEALLALEPLLTVVIACRDAAGTLGGQLLALAAQQSPWPWEVVVVDNRSQDASAALALAHASRLPALRVVAADERDGPAYARNVGARQARGRWLLFCDADDEVGPGWLAAMAGALARDDLVAGRFDANRLNAPRVVASRPVDQTDDLQHSPAITPLPHAGAGNLGVRAELFRTLGGFDETLPVLEDTEFCWRAQAEAGARLVFLPEAVVHVRLRSTWTGMFRQGRSYGRAYAELERRAAQGSWATAGPPGDSPSAVPTGAVPAPTRGPRRRPGGPGAVLWRVGWHVGRRSGKAAGSAAEL